MKNKGDKNEGIKSITSALLRWYSASARDLPWRREPDCKDPYRVHVSEAMLQQTQVKTVIPYYERWIRELPDVRSLARADTSRVLKLWEGLGYYSRARNLQHAAQIVVKDFAGRYPHDVADILKLPGIGRYTAGAIASIAFNQPEPILDGNVIRVVTRLFAIRNNPKESRAHVRLWKLAAQFVCIAASQPDPQNKNCSHLNQALMELGALICSPRSPACNACPVRSFCLGYKRGLLEKIPALPPRKMTIRKQFVAVVAKKDSRYLVMQRPPKGINANLWEFPNEECSSASINNDNGGEPTTRRIAGCVFKNLSQLTTVRHAIMHHRITVQVFRAELVNRCADSITWRRLSKLKNLAFSGAHRKILSKL